MSPLFPLPVEGFPGLDLQHAPDELGFSGAIDLLNVDFDRSGQVRTRDGFAKFTSVAGTNRYDSMSVLYDTASGLRELVAGAGLRLDAINTSGSITHSDTTPVTSPHYFARFGSQTASSVYIANGLDTVKRYDGSSFSTPTYTGTTPTGLFLATTPWDNRLVNAGIKVGSTKNVTARVLFSDPGTPTTFGANNYIDLDPGDGEQIQGLVTWREFLFVFKESKFYVFYGTSTDSSGNPIFNYRTIRGTGAKTSALAATPDAVYFINQRGVWATTGGPATLVSSVLDPIFRGSPSSFFGSSPLNQAQIGLCSMAWNDNRLYFAYPSGSSTANDRMFVYTPSIGTWTLWDIPAAAMVPFRVASTDDLLFAYASGTKDIGRHVSSYSDDAGIAITSRYQSGFDNLAPPRRFAAHYLFGNTRKRFRKWKVTGTGNVTFGIAHDFGSVNQSSNLTLGVSPAIKDGWFNTATRGQLISYKLSGSSPWSVQKLTAYLAGSEPPLLGNPSDE